jgi:O-antigen/teichoic acid export membrane protein
MLPVFSANQLNKPLLKKMVKRSIVTSSYLIFPMMMILIVVADPLIRILLTEKWLPSVQFLQLMSISYSFWPISTANQQVVIALGRSDVILKLELVNKSIGMFALFISIPFGIGAMVLSKVIVSFISAFINSIPNKKYLKYSFFDQWRDVFPAILLSIFVGILISYIKLFNFTAGATLLLQILSGISLYILLSIVFKVESFDYIIKLIRSKTS